MDFPKRGFYRGLQPDGVTLSNPAQISYAAFQFGDPVDIERKAAKRRAKELARARGEDFDAAKVRLPQDARTYKRPECSVFWAFDDGALTRLAKQRTVREGIADWQFRSGACRVPLDLLLTIETMYPGKLAHELREIPEGDELNDPNPYHGNLFYYAKDVPEEARQKGFVPVPRRDFHMIRERLVGLVNKLLAAEDGTPCPTSQRIYVGIDELQRRREAS